MGWTPTTEANIGWGPVPEAAQGGAAAPAAGSILRSHFDFAAEGVEDWQAAGDVAQAITPVAGTVTAPVNFNVVNTASMTAGNGPDGSTGIKIKSTAGDWYSAALPTSGNFKASVTDLIGSTPNAETEIWFVAEISGTIPDTNYSHFGIGIEEAGVWVTASRVRNAVQNWTWSKGTSQVKIAGADTDVWLAIRVGNDASMCRYGVAGTDALPTTWDDSGTLAGRCSLIATVTPTTAATAPLLDLSAANIVLWTGPHGGTTFEATFKSLRVYEVVT
jgi:hypothetical protein